MSTDFHFLERFARQAMLAQEFFCLALASFAFRGAVAVYNETTDTVTLALPPAAEARGQMPDRSLAVSAVVRAASLEFGQLVNAVVYLGGSIRPRDPLPNHDAELVRVGGMYRAVEVCDFGAGSSAVCLHFQGASLMTARGRNRPAEAFFSKASSVCVRVECDRLSGNWRGEEAPYSFSAAKTKVS